MKMWKNFELVKLMVLHLLFVFIAGLRAVAHLWQEFVLEMRFRWENDIFVPRYGSPSKLFCNVRKANISLVKYD